MFLPLSAKLTVNGEVNVTKEPLPTAVSICHPCAEIAEPLGVTVGEVKDKSAPLHTAVGADIALKLGALLTVIVIVLLSWSVQPDIFTNRLKSVVSVKAPGL